METRDFDKLRLPKIYKRNGRDYYLDPIRKKLVYITPEETVRQRVISYLIDELNVPPEMILVEEHLSHYGIDTKRRADIVIHADSLDVPIAVVECKAPNVYLDEKAVNQMFDYMVKLDADYAMVINGNSQFCFKYDEDDNEYDLIEVLPAYKDMLQGKCKPFNRGEMPERTAFEDIENHLKNVFENMAPEDIGTDIGKNTPMEIAAPMFNLWDGLLDERKRIPTGDYGLFNLIEDYGVRLLSYGNANGGNFGGPYRSFLVDVNGSTEFYSLGFTTYYTNGNTDQIKTCLCVAHDDDENSHHALQLVADENIVVNGDVVEFYHHGRIAVGNIGSGKICELREFVKARCPELIKENKFYLGSIKNDRLWSLDDSEVVNVVINLIKYAMIRDEYRDYVKKNRG